MCLPSPQETVQKLLDAARSGGFQAVQQAVSDLIAEGWLVRCFSVCVDVTTSLLQACCVPHTGHSNAQQAGNA